MSSVSIVRSVSEDNIFTRSINFFDQFLSTVHWKWIYIIKIFHLTTMKKLYTTVTMFIYAIKFSSVSLGQLIRSVDIYKDLIEGVHLHFNNTCIIFLHNVPRPIETQGMGDGLKLREIQHYFSGLGIRTAIMDLPTFTKKVGLAYFNIKRPLFVLLNDYDKLRDDFAHGISTWITMAYPTWVVLFRRENVIQQFFSEIYVPFDCVFLVSQQSAEDNHTEIVSEVYQVEKDVELRVSIFGELRDSILSVPKKGLYQRRGDLFGKEIRVGALHDPPLSMIIRNEEKEMIGLQGFFGTIIGIIQKSMNCTFVFEEAESWGITLPNGSSSGIVDMLQKNQVDLAAVGLTMTKTRLDQIAFTTPIYTSRSRLYIKKPDYAAIKWKAYTAPFGLGIWNLIIITILLSGLCIYSVQKFLQESNADSDSSESTANRLYEIVFLVYGAICSQGMEHPLFDSVKLIHVVVHITGVILLSAYSAALISFLAVEVVYMPFTTMEGFLEDETYNFGVVGDSADYDFFRYTTDSILHKMFETKLEKVSSLPNNYYEGLKNVCGKQRHAFMTLDNMVAILQAKVNCSLEPLDVIMQTTNAMAVSKRSPYRGIINTNILMMQDSGVMQRLFANEWAVEPNAETNTFNSVKIVDIVPLLLVVAGGVAIGIVLLSLERFFHAYLELSLRTRFEEVKNQKKTNQEKVKF